MLRKISSLIVAMSAAAIFSAATAAPKIPWHPIVALDGGYAFMSTSTQTTEFAAYSDALFTLRDQANNYSQKMWGGFAGVEWQVKPLWTLQTGVAYYQPVSIVVRGNESQGVIGSPETTDFYTYRYTITPQQVLAEAKLLYTFKEKYFPFVLVGMGASFDSVRSYGINYPAFLTFVPEFSSHNVTAFSYRLGIGLDYATSDDLRVGIGYYFSDFGKVQTGSGHVDDYGVRTNLQQPHLLANELVAQMTMIL
jgi:opacity protein-like surface antigen